MAWPATRASARVSTVAWPSENQGLFAPPVVLDTRPHMANCPACGRDNPEGFQFCGFCASLLVPGEGHDVRKTVTVLFSDVTGSTALGELLDPESLHDVMSGTSTWPEPSCSVTAVRSRSSSGTP